MENNLLVNKIKKLIDLKENNIKASILIKGTSYEFNLIIKNLFLENFVLEEEKLGGITKIDIEKKVDIYFAKNESINSKNIKKLNEKTESYDVVIECYSMLSKRINKNMLLSINETKKANKNLLVLLTDIECLDSREFNEMKSTIDEYLIDIDILSVMNDSKYKNELNQWDDLVKEIASRIDENKRGNFYKAQILQYSYKREVAATIVAKYIDVLKDIEDNFDKESLLYLENKMIDEILSVYPVYGQEVGSNIKLVITQTVDRLVLIKENKAKKALREKRRLEKIEKEKREKLEKEEAENRKLEEKIREIEAQKRKEEALYEAEIIEESVDNIIIDAEFVVDDMLGNRRNSYSEQKDFYQERESSYSMKKTYSYDVNEVAEIERKIEKCIAKVLDEKMDNLIMQLKNQIKDEVMKEILK